MHYAMRSFQAPSVRSFLSMQMRDYSFSELVEKIKRQLQKRRCGMTILAEVVARTGVTEFRIFVGCSNESC